MSGSQETYSGDANSEFNGGTNSLKSILFDQGACWMVFQISLKCQKDASRSLSRFT